MRVCVSLAQVVGGYPVLTDSLAWPGFPLFIIGLLRCYSWDQQQAGRISWRRSDLPLFVFHFCAQGLKLGT